MGGKARASDGASRGEKAVRKARQKAQKAAQKKGKKAIKKKRKALVQLMVPGQSYSRLQLRGLLRASGVAVSNTELQRTIRRLIKKGDVVRRGQRAGARWSLA